ncbi:hypothetical protein WJX74_002123 [Apatococcus lobatus]|uniref:MPN domain-containing protein n=2 Tax=Apatococcus TaxID=904362 RepID=A0AAW1SKH3_9CHLO
MSKVYKVDPKALLKVLLHSFKYPSASVNGVLFGSAQTATGTTSQADSSDRLASGSQIHIVEAVPLCHSFLSLAPSLEVAFIQAELAAKQQGLEVVGYYHVNQRLNDLELGPVARRLADRIYQSNSDSCVLLVDNNRLRQFLRGLECHIFELFTKDGGRGWSKQNASSSSQLECLSTGLAAKAVQLHKEGRHRQLQDFDDHLECLERDWLNVKLNA